MNAATAHTTYDDTVTALQGHATKLRGRPLRYRNTHSALEREFPQTAPKRKTWRRLTDQAQFDQTIETMP